MFQMFVLLFLVMIGTSFGRLPQTRNFVVYRSTNMIENKENSLASVMPGESGMVGGVGLATVIGIYQKVIIARFALSWFPQLYSTFPFLSPVYSVTEPYLQFFRRFIPPIGGFDISAIPALFILDFATNLAVSFGAELPDDEELVKMKMKLEEMKKNTNPI